MSAHYNRPLLPGCFAVGELGFGHAITPHTGGRLPKLGGMSVLEVRRLSQAMGDL